MSPGAEKSYQEIQELDRDREMGPWGEASGE
jgi:hypothetical protein